MADTARTTKVLRAPDIAILRRLDTEGPLVLPDATSHRLWLRDLVDRHGPHRYRISALGRAKLYALDAEPSP